jgi:hypothetical protein
VVMMTPAPDGVMIGYADVSLGRAIRVAYGFEIRQKRWSNRVRR